MKITWKHQDSDFTYPLSLEDKITIFYERVYGWQLRIADICANGDKEEHLTEIPHSGFAVLHIVLSYFETIAKYEAGFAKNGDSEKFFKRGVQLVFPKLALQNQTEVDRFLSKLYSYGRCGLYHRSMALPGIALGEIDGVAMAFHRSEQRLIINPKLLPGFLINHLCMYRNRLLDIRAGLKNT